LLGILGKTAIVKNSDYPDEGILQLRKRMEAILSWNKSEFSFKAQIAAAESMLDISVGMIQNLEIANEWFRSLNSEQKSQLPSTLLQDLLFIQSLSKNV